MKKTILAICLCHFACIALAQNVGIGTNTPESSALLEIKSINKGLLLPRLTTTARNAISSPAKGLLLYDSTLKQFGYHDGTAWQMLLPNGANAAGWRTINSAHGDDRYFSTVPDVTKRVVFINSPIMSSGGYYGQFKNGGLNIINPQVGNYEFLLSMDGRGIQARRQDANNYNSYEDQHETNLLLNKFGGNVGIFNDNPTYAKLMVNGNVGSSVAMFGADRYGVTISSNNPEIGFNYYYDNGTRTMRGGYAGYIGMSPSDGSIYFGNFAGSYNSGTFSSISGAVSRMTILQNGNVGIGTVNPTYKLSVNGNIRSKEVIVESGWADYVFADDYKLPSLKETEKFIAENKHLPGIPSAKEIQENGLSVGEIQTKMMAKIEELTLHVIELKKEIEQLKSKKL